MISEFFSTRVTRRCNTTHHAAACSALGLALMGGWQQALQVWARLLFSWRHVFTWGTAGGDRTVGSVALLPAVVSDTLLPPAAMLAAEP